MIRRLDCFVLAAIAAAFVFYAPLSRASGDFLFDANVTPDVIFGSGNANGGFTVDRNNGVELGLRAKVRFPVPQNTFNSNGNGTYTHEAGSFGGLAGWNFEFAVNTDWEGNTGNFLNDFTYLLEMDTDRTSAVNFSIAFDLITPPTSNPNDFFDHAIGTNATGNGGGTTATSRANYEALVASNNVAQNSWNIGFFNQNNDYDPEKSGIYDFRLTAFDGANVVAQTQIQVFVVPEPSSAIWVLSSIVGLAFIRRRRI